MLDRGALEIAAGKLERPVCEGQAARMTWRPRGAASTRTLLARRIVNCSGPQGDLERAGEPLTDSLSLAG